MRLRCVVLFSLCLAWPALLFAEQGAPPAGQTPPGTAPQAPAPAASQGETGAPGGQQPPVPPEAPKPSVHRFWDKKNDWLFAGVLGARFLDFASTLNARRRGLNEALLTNAIVDNHGEFAAIEFAGAAASVGVSYWFHHAGHHRLEHWVSYIHIGVTVFGAARNYALKTPHPQQVTPVMPPPASF